MGPHAIFIIASWVLTLAAVGGLAIWVVLDHRALRATLADLEQRGLTRGRPPQEPSA